MIKTNNNRNKTTHYDILRNMCKLLLPLATMGLILTIHLQTPNVYPKNYQSNIYPTIIIFGMILYSILSIISMRFKTLKKKLLYISLSLSASILIMECLDIATLKTGRLTLPYIPSPDQILQTIPDHYSEILVSTISSLKLLGEGVFLGIIFGLISGILMGWSKIWNYWLSPILRFIGPIPAIAWIPIVMVLMPTSKSAGVFLIFLAVWFPITLNLSSAIQNTDKQLIEAAQIMGSSSWYILRHIALPSSLPSLFNGLFMGICSSFSALISAEMLGVESGLGWYMQWAKSWAEYSRVYSTVLIFIIMFFIIIEGLFRLRDRMMRWQKNSVRW